MKKLLKYLKIILGSFVVGMTINVFFKDLSFIPNGIYGFDLLYGHIVNLNLGLIIFLANLFFWVLGYLLLPKIYLKNAILPFCLVPLFTFLTSKLGNILLIKTADPLLLCVFGGALMGIGYKLIYKENCAVSATDIINKIGEGIFGDKSEIITYTFDAIWITIAIFVFGIENAMYSVIIIIIIEIMSKRTSLGISDSKIFYIITKKEKEVKNYIMKELHHDLTVYDVKGGFTRSSNKVIMTVISTEEYYKLREGIKLIDSGAFISITDSYEVINQNKTLKQYINK